MARTPAALTIAGSDSGGGAGIQADLKAFARCGVHGCSAITAITAQNTVGVDAILELDPEMVRAQVRAVLADIEIGAVKVGMLASAPIAAAVAASLDELAPGTPVVVDPVMVAESGARLLAPEAERALAELVVARAAVVTPNVPEARVLAGFTIGADAAAAAEPEQLLSAVLELGAGAAVLTGGHRTPPGAPSEAGQAGGGTPRGTPVGAHPAGHTHGGAPIGAQAGRQAGERAVDLFATATEPARVVEIDGPRHPDGAAHGSGCTHSAVLAAQLALGHAPLEAARTARALAGEAVARGLRDIGAGAGPVDVIGLEGLRRS